jgi:hypothetical protein
MINQQAIQLQRKGVRAAEERQQPSTGFTMAIFKNNAFGVNKKKQDYN